MTYYRHDGPYQCSTCQQVFTSRSKKKFVVSRGLCRKCWAKLRPKNSMLELQDSVVVTANVEKRLRKTAEERVPKEGIERLGDLIAGRYSVLFFWISAAVIALVAFDEFSAWLWLFVFFWAFVLPYGLILLTDQVLVEPRARRKELIDAQVLELARERQDEIEERNAFYSSPEWQHLRAQVIKEEGNTCDDCGVRVTRKSELAVDHKRPRSKYPDLALSRDNLRVICRSCNSRKGSGEWLE